MRRSVVARGTTAPMRVLGALGRAMAFIVLVLARLIVTLVLAVVTILAMPVLADWPMHRVSGGVLTDARRRRRLRLAE